tara:strand:+ start:3041 stop:4870 length:1830 start_codon:yes stop_codon:yes gene_type:complete
VAGKTVDIDQIIDGKEAFAEAIATQYTEWEMLRRSWIDEKKELRNYIFATDTTKTTNSKLPWKNSTTIPKICQIRDNLHANYMAALFPNDDWLNWEAEDREGANGEKRNVIESYMKNKTRVAQFRRVVSQLVLDYIDYGNCFSSIEYFDETRIDPITNEEYPGFVGPKPIRISPYDIVFNPLAPDFDSAPKIIRSIKSIGELKVELEENPEKGYLNDVLDVMINNRAKVQAISSNDMAKSEGLQIDGFSSIHHYYSSNYVELLEFVGDIYDQTEGKLYKDYIITVADRTHIIRKIPNPTWRKSTIRHVGWRIRPDNLYAMGPLDNLVGMQYRIDHLENLKADVFDLIAHPVMKIKGFVEEFDYGPGERIFVGDDGDVEFMRPDASALAADNQIDRLEQKMEELAGAPKQAMGMRTPGEKTAFEVQSLQNAAGRIFQNKISYFEQMFLEPLLNDMLETARRNMNGKDIVKSIDNDLGVQIFQDITRDDLLAKGRIYPMGARHFAAKANMIQNLTQLSSSPLGQDPSISVHISGKKMAKLIEELLDLEKFNLVQDNIRVFEQQETQQLINSAQGQVDEQAAMSGQLEGIPADDQAATDGLALPPQDGGGAY